MTKYRFDREGTWVYPSIHVTATNGDVIDSTYRIDQYWTQVANTTPATIPPPRVILPPYSEVPDGAFLVYDSAAHRFVPSQVSPFDANGVVKEEGLPARLSQANLDTLYTTPQEVNDLIAANGGGGGTGGLPVGGTLNQVLGKQSATDFDVAWMDQAGGVTQAQLDAVDAKTATNATDIGTNATDIGTNTTAINNLTAQQDQLMSTAATTEELFVTAQQQAVPDGAGGTTLETSGLIIFTGFVAPFALEIVSCSFTREYTDIAASSTNYLEIQLQRTYSDGTLKDTIVTKSTASEALTARKPWNFDGAVWGASDLAAGEALRIHMDPVGTATVRCPGQFTIRYRPL